MAGSQNEDRTVVLARIQSGPGVDAIAAALGNNPSPYQTDAMLCSAVDVQVQTTTLQRVNYNPSLSKDKTGVGRMLQQLTFTHELRTSGAFGVAPRLGRLLRACGMQETTIPNTAPAIIGNPVGGAGNSANAIAATGGITKGAAVPTKNFDTYRLYVTTAGVGATAKVIVVGAGFQEGDNTVLNSLNHSAWTNSKLGTVVVAGTATAPTYTFGGTYVVNEMLEVWVGGIRYYYQIPTGGNATTAIATAVAAMISPDARFVGTAAAGSVITVTLAGSAIPQDTLTGAVSPITLGASGAVVNLPSGFAALAVGDYWDVTLKRPGVRYDPISENIPLLTFYVYLDGTLHIITDARGTFTMSAVVNTFPTLSFTFTGRFNEPIDAPVPSSLVNFEQSKPYKVELAEAAVYGMPNVCAESFTMDLGGTVVPKDCMNAEEGTDEIRFTERTPVAGVNPESSKPSVWSPWTRMRREEVTRLHVRGGSRGGTGNIWRFQADSAQITGANYANRNKIRAHDLAFALSRVSDAGDDEFFYHFG